MHSVSVPKYGQWQQLPPSPLQSNLGLAFKVGLFEKESILIVEVLTFLHGQCRPFCSDQCRFFLVELCGGLKASCLYAPFPPLMACLIAALMACLIAAAITTLTPGVSVQHIVEIV